VQVLRLSTVAVGGDDHAPRDPDRVLLADIAADDVQTQIDTGGDACPGLSPAAAGFLRARAEAGALSDRRPQYLGSTRTGAGVVWFASVLGVGS